jgi:hypothetical protein
MNTLKQWKLVAAERGHTRIAELCDYVQADELMHVKIATKWIRRLTESNPAKREELAEWGRKAVARIESFYADNGYVEQEVRFTFRGGSGGEFAASHSNVVGE